MKHIILSLSLIASAFYPFAQDPAEPCCAVVGVNPTTNLVTARNNSTGRLFMYRVSPAEIGSIKLYDPLSTNASFTYVVDPKYGANKYFVAPANFTQIKNESSLGLVRLNYSEPCCTIIAIEKAEPCCNTVAVQNSTTGEVIRFKVPVEVGQGLKNKNVVYMEPGQTSAMAIIESNWQSLDSSPNYFSFPVDSKNTDENLSSLKWELTPLDEPKENLGRLNTHFEEGVDWGIDVFTDPARQPVMSPSSRHRGKELYSEMAPGIYNFRMNMVMIENVPIVQGKITRLRSGLLHIKSDVNWDLYDDSKTNIIISGIKSQKLALPLGGYQLKINGHFFPFQITDGQTFEH